MKYTIRKNKGVVVVQDDWTVDEYCKQLADENNCDTARALFAIEFFMKCFPKFKEVVINSELTDNEQDNNTKRDDQ